MALIRISKSPFFLLLLILLLASFFRLWQLSDAPPGLYPDEALNANTAIEALEKGEYQVFYVDNNGREGLYMNLVALSFGFFGISMWSFRIVGAVAGILTFFGLYFLVREIFLLFWSKTRQATLIALFSSFFLAISFWHINFSRIGFRAVLMPLVLVFSFYFLLRGFRSRQLWHFIAAGLLFGIGFHTYISFRLAVLPLAILILIWFLLAAKERWLKKYTKSVVLFSLFLFLTALPIGLYFLQNPQDFISRATGISVFATDAPLLSFGKSLARHLAMFHIS